MSYKFESHQLLVFQFKIKQKISVRPILEAAMTIAGRFEVKAVVVLGLAFSCFVAEAISRRGLIDAGPTDFNVNSYGAKADDKTNNEQVS
jgi:hypothetical protein